jgi:hypothetical protein
MTARTVFLGACVGILALGAATLPTEARDGRNGGAAAAGAAAGFVAGAILGGGGGQPYYPAPGFAPGPPAYSGAYGDDEDCRVVVQRTWVDGYGWQARRVRVCD